MTLYENDKTDVFLCQNCDSEFTVLKIDDDLADVCFCPYCGDPVVEIDDEDLDEDLLSPDDDNYLN